MRFVEIPWQSELYEKAVQLRNEILRMPLGLEFSDDEIAAESEQLHFGIEDDDQLVACVVIVPLDNHHVKLRQMAVSKKRHRAGIGSMLIRHVESVLASRGVTSIEMHARSTAVGFYERLGYSTFGREFVEVTIPHWKMKKNIVGPPSP